MPHRVLNATPLSKSSRTPPIAQLPLDLRRGCPLGTRSPLVKWQPQLLFPYPPGQVWENLESDQHSERIWAGTGCALQVVRVPRTTTVDELERETTSTSRKRASNMEYCGRSNLHCCTSSSQLPIED